MKQKRFLTKKLALVTAIVLVVAICVWMWVNHKSNSSDTSNPPINTASKQASPHITKPIINPDANVPGGSTGASDNSNVTLLTPWGNFVSNHSPGENGSPTTEQSVCNTSAGASCYIKFTKDGDTKTLSAKTADANGTTSWRWDTNSVGLTSGKWQVTAMATLEGQTKSATDQIELTVQ